MTIVVPERVEPSAPTMIPAPPMPPVPTGMLLKDGGILNLRDQFKTETIGPLEDQIMEWNMMPEDKAPDRIMLRINSPGGSVHAAFELIDVMKQSRIPVHTLNLSLIHI